MANNWNSFSSFNKLPRTPYRRYSLVVPGFCIPFRNTNGNDDEFRIYVVKQEGKYLCKLSYKWGECDDWGRNVDNWDQYPDALFIFNNFSPDNAYFKQYTTKEWINRKNAYIKSYKYVDFGEHKDEAVEFMKQVEEEVKKMNNKK